MSDSKIPTWAKPRSEDEIRGLLERARGGDATELAALREALDHHPEVWRAYGDLAAHAREAWIDLIAGADLALKESLGRQVEAMEDDLAGPAPSPLEKLLVERIVACWLQVNYADAAAAQAGDVSIQLAKYIVKRQDSAHRRYLTAVGALATTGRLLGSAAGGSKAVLPPTGPSVHGGLEPARGGLEGPGAGPREGDRPEDGLVLEFGQSRGAGPGGIPRSRRRARDTS